MKVLVFVLNLRVIVGANGIRPLLMTSAAHQYVRESHKDKMHLVIFIV